MSIINYIFKIIVFILFSFSLVNAEEIKKVGKFKDWETLILIKDNEIICFAQSKPVLQSPKANKRDETIKIGSCQRARPTCILDIYALKLAQC